jgi:hypothetical protein
MVGKKFKAAVIAMAPDAVPRRNWNVLETSSYQLTTVLVRDEDEAVRYCRKLASEAGVQSFLLCPGFTNRGVARVSKAVGDKVSVNVARGDGPSNVLAHRYMEEAGFFEKR